MSLIGILVVILLCRLKASETEEKNKGKELEDTQVVIHALSTVGWKMPWSKVLHYVQPALSGATERAMLDSGMLENTFYKTAQDCPQKWRFNLKIKWPFPMIACTCEIGRLIWLEEPTRLLAVDSIKCVAVVCETCKTSCVKFTTCPSLFSL